MVVLAASFWSGAEAFIFTTACLVVVGANDFATAVAGALDAAGAGADAISDAGVAAADVAA